MKKKLIIVRGGGDLATGIIQKFFRAGFAVLVLETMQPLAIRKTVALCQAVYDGEVMVEDMVARLVNNCEEMVECWTKQKIPIVIDPQGEWISILKPDVVVDAIIAKRNIGTTRDMAPIVIGMGPGFKAGYDVDVVIETMRGHNLGRLIFEGEAYPNTGVPGDVNGKSFERVIHAPIDGKIKVIKQIGDIVVEGEAILMINQTNVYAPFTGLIRGMIEDGLVLNQKLKIADIDPRTDVDWRTISDKARNIGGGALEAFLYLRHQNNQYK